MKKQRWFGYEHTKCKYCVKKVKSYAEMMEFCDLNKAEVLKNTNIFIAVSRKEAMTRAKRLLDMIKIEIKETEVKEEIKI